MRYSLYKKMVQSVKNILDMIFVQNVFVFVTISKRNNCSFCCFLNHIICFWKSRVMLCFVRQITFVPHFIVIEEIVMKVSWRWYSQKNILDMIFVQNVCVFVTISKRNNCSFCCFLNHIICFWKSRVMLCFVRQITFVPHFIVIEEIVMKVSGGVGEGGHSTFNWSGCAAGGVENRTLS